jgi:hypothetical protein
MAALPPARILSQLGLQPFSQSPRVSLSFGSSVRLKSLSSVSYDQIIKANLLQCLQEDAELLQHTYEECFERRQPTLLLLEKRLKTTIRALAGSGHNQTRVYILLDGLDNCKEDKQRR